MILDSTFSSWREIAQDQAGPLLCRLVSDDHSAVDTLQELPTELSVLIVHGDSDSIIGAKHFHTLCEAAAGREKLEFELLPGLDHLEPLVGNPRGETLLLDFIERHAGEARYSTAP